MTNKKSPRWNEGHTKTCRSLHQKSARVNPYRPLHRHQHRGGGS